MPTFTITASVDCDTLEQAQQVAAERLSHDEDYGFPYQLSWAEVIEQPGVWHIVRTADNYYAETVRGVRADAEQAAAEYRPNPWTEPGLAHVVAGGAEDYPATVSARRMYGDSYADYIQRSTDEKLAKGIDQRELSLGALLRGNDGL